MKKMMLATALCFATTTQLSAQTAPAFDLADIHWGETHSVNFSVDNLPVDGVLGTLNIALSEGSYRLSFSRTYVNRATGEYVTKVTDLGDDFSCETNAEATKASCEVDLRPVDGALTLVDMTLNAQNLYDVSKTSKFFNRITGTEVEKTVVLLEDATLALPITTHAK